MAMAMARARMRMAISNGFNGIRQISVRHFQAGASRNYLHSSANGSYFTGAAAGLWPSPCVFTIIFGFFCYNVSEDYKMYKWTKERKERRKESLQEKGITREYCEASIAKLKQKMESGPLSSSDRLDLEWNQEWLDELTD